ncbi:family 43 glycosylhydrolase [Hymenobacter sp. BT730]|uniref:family 43 glycosylhydrolase n=1 Tax=Hymenobacter sp. BT730 TaxID=3063332 RepID=UPI0026E08BCB|nr:family 43 glycosylhydrolase [Hymenobacter sp. BT730]
MSTPILSGSRASDHHAGPFSHLLRLAVLVMLLLAGTGYQALALQGAVGVHDPSTMVKDGNKYWIFATGQGIYSMYSTDLVNWTAGSKAVFVNNAYPSWINTKVKDFKGHFWAPEVIFMNGKYYLYYSCSTFGSKVSAIGLATNVTLDPASPNYKWEDQGEVISTDANSAVNAIDPAVFKDTNGDVWLSYGSFFGGIRITRLNASTGKLTGTTQYAVANNNPEAAYLTKNGSYYYLFINRGACCNGVNSTYHILVGRSTSPTGPFLDQKGVDLNSGGGTVVLNTSGRYIGPGHTGIFQENGVSYFSHHYYDGQDNGVAKLSLAKLTWSAAGWPVVSRDWVTTGRYEIKNQNSQLIWGSSGCSGVTGQAIAQATPTGLDCQRWDITAMGDGEYKITNALGGLAADVAGCSADNGAKLQLKPYSELDCQRFRIDRVNNGSVVLASTNGNRVIEVPGASTTAGQQLALWDYNGCNCQQWALTDVTIPTASATDKQLKGVTLFPIPATRNGFTIELGSQKARQATIVEMYNVRGQMVYLQSFSRQQSRLEVAPKLPSGIYLVQVRQDSGFWRQKVTIQ